MVCSHTHAIAIRGLQKAGRMTEAAANTRRRDSASRRKTNKRILPGPSIQHSPLPFPQDSDDGGATARIVTISVLGVVGALMLANVVLYYLAQSQKGASGGKKKKVGAKKAKRQAMMGGMRVLGD